MVRDTEVLPMLHTIMLHGLEQVKPLMAPLWRPFIDARKLSDRPVAVSWTPH